MRTYTRIFIVAYKEFIDYTFSYKETLRNIYNPSDNLSYVKLNTRPIVGNKKADNIYFTKWRKIQDFLTPYWGPSQSSELRRIYMP